MALPIRRAGPSEGSGRVPAQAELTMSDRDLDLHLSISIAGTSGIQSHVAERMADTSQHIASRLRLRVEPVLASHLHLPVKQTRLAGSTLALTAGGWYFDARRS